MRITEELLDVLQNRLKVGSRRGVHLNAIPARSRYKFDLTRLSHIDKNLPKEFINSLLTKQPLKFKVSWKDNVPDLNSLFVEDQIQLVKITKSFENLINQTAAIESEKGINTFGFGFPLLVRRDQADRKLTVAPILIWSLRIKRSKEFNTWVIYRDEDDPIHINEVLINHLQNDSKINLEQLSSDLLDDGLIDRNELLDICESVIETINSTTPNDLREKFNEKLKNIVSISEKRHYEELPLTSTNSFIEFGGLFSIFEVQKQNIIHDYGNMLDLNGATINVEDMDEKHTYQSISSVETDPSQQGILNSLENKRNVLIQGPPGTGKSQSLTAILVNALENKKKTIVVCEKRTALEVLHKSLNEKGLNSQCVLIKDIKKDRRAVVNSVRNRIDNRNYRFYDQINNTRGDLDGTIEKAEYLIYSINQKHKKLGENLLGSKNWTRIVGELLAELKGNNEDFNLEFENDIFKYELTELNHYLELIRKGEELYNEYEPNKEFSFLNPLKLNGINPFIVEDQIKEDFKQYESEFLTILQKTTVYHQEYFDFRKNEIADDIKHCRNLSEEFNSTLNKIPIALKKFRDEYKKIRTSEYQNELDSIKEKADEVNSIFNEYSSNNLFLDNASINSFSFKFKSLFSKGLKKLKRDRNTISQRILDIDSILIECKDLPKVDFNSDIKDNKRAFFLFKKALVKTSLNFDSKLTNELNEFSLENFNSENIGSQLCFKYLKSLSSSGSNKFNTLIERTLIDLQEIQFDLITKKNDVLNFIESSNDLPTLNVANSLNAIKTDFVNYFELLDKSNNDFIDAIKGEIENLDIFNPIDEKYQMPILYDLITSYKNLTNKINSDSWTNLIVNIIKEESTQNKIAELLKTNEDFFSNENDLFRLEFEWFQFYNSVSELERAIIDQLLEKTNWKKVFLIHYLQSMLVKSANTDLPTNDKDHKELSKSLSNLEQEQINYINGYWYSKQIGATNIFDTKHNNLKVENLYSKKAGKNHKRLSLREIVEYDIDLFTTFFPIILTTPDVCSNLFKGKNKYFDIVMFDEASQLKVEDNLPALLKGKQVIIAGDEHQMPPSNYFSKIFDGSMDDEDEDDFESEPGDTIVTQGLLAAESLLQFAEELNFEKKHLDFHYRSRHPFLIDFSNYAFYHQRLKPLPNSFEYTPIKYIQVNGTYLDHTNDLEAETVLSIIDNNINRLPDGKYPSVGIATFNIHQRNLILSKINERRKLPMYAVFNEKILELEGDGLFVKNLENIQGDERDVIILTTTYGINKDGKFLKRFGSINHPKGYKLINVIITRAKYKVYVCSSIPQEVFLNYKEFLSIEGSNNRSAVFFAYLAYSKAVSENDTEQRLSILNALAENTTDAGTIGIPIGDLESPFEEEVYQALTEHFDESKIIPQLQFGGFRIDIVYDSKIAGIPKIAIECDGAAYHSSQEAYLNDIHRQKILEGHGFIFHRIWSTNWWRGPERETKILVDFIKQVEKDNHSAFEDKSEKSNAFTDDVKVANGEPQKNILEIQKAEETILAISTDEIIQANSFKNAVQVGSEVKVKYVNNGEEINVQIVETEEILPKIANGIQKINMKSPLAVALIGKGVGETSKVGSLDNYIEILEIN